MWLRVNGFFPTTDAPSTQRDLNIFASVGALGLLSVTIWGWRAYYKFSIRTDERGITQTGWRGEKFVDWQDIIDFYRGDNSFYITAKSGAGCASATISPTAKSCAMKSRAAPSMPKYSLHGRKSLLAPARKPPSCVTK